MSDDQRELSEKQRPHHFPWVTLILAITLITFAILAYRAYIKTGQGIKEVAKDTTDTVKKVLGVIPEAAAKFKTGTITHTFIEYIPDVSSTGGDVLEVATSHSPEDFIKPDSKSIAWNMIYLGTTVSEIRVPATFRYHIRLSDQWRLAARKNVCIVLAPPIRVSTPTAIQTDQMQKSTDSGWARFNKDDNLAELEKSITSELDRRAGDPQHMKLVREACRQSVAAFVKKWLLKEDYWRTGRFTAVIIKFPDEVTANTDQDLEEIQSDQPTTTLQ